MRRVMEQRRQGSGHLRRRGLQVWELEVGSEQVLALLLLLLLLQKEMVL